MEFRGGFVVFVNRSIEQRLAAAFNLVLVSKGPEEALTGAKIGDWWNN